MPRTGRINVPGLTHHIMARTFDDLALFRDDADRRVYLSFFAKRIQETGFKCYAWVLMDTHVHLLVRTTEEPLWKLMKPLGSDYAHYYNRRYNRRGPLFCDRYKSVATQDQNYLEELIRYIHLNPVRAGNCHSLSSLNRYKWCGHRAIMTNEKNGFQEIGVVLKRFGKTDAEARRKYLAFLKAGIGKDDDIARAVRVSNEGKGDRNITECWVIGDAEFQKDVLAKAEKNRLSIARYKREGIALNDVLKATCRKTGVEPDDVLARSKRSARSDARKVFCYFASQLGFPTFETGRFLGIGQAAVSNAARTGKTIAEEKKISWSIV